MKAISLICWGALCLSSLQGAANYPTPVPAGDLERSPYIYTGLLSAPDWWGSGSVAIHPRVVVGCAHVNFDDEKNAWLPNGKLRWFWKWNQETFPEDADGRLLTGYYYFSGYRTAVMSYGGSSPEAFSQDFVANYSVSMDLAGGWYAPGVSNGRGLLLATGRKCITGYPIGRYAEGDLDEYKMHVTGEFSEAMYVDKDNYLGLDDVETGSGNSGGPVWAQQNGNWALAGVLISGVEAATDGYSSIGVYSISQAGWGLVVSALGKMIGAKTQVKNSFSAPSLPVAIPDNQSSIQRTFTAANMVGTISTLTLDLSITHGRRGDLQVTLRSPQGTTVTLLKSNAKDKAVNLRWTRKAVSGFKGQDANGVWTMTVVDKKAGTAGNWDSAQFNVVTK